MVRTSHGQFGRHNHHQYFHSLERISAKHSPATGWARAPSFETCPCSSAATRRRYGSPGSAASGFPASACSCCSARRCGRHNLGTEMVSETKTEQRRANGMASAGGFTYRLFRITVNFVLQYFGTKWKEVTE